MAKDASVFLLLFFLFFAARFALRLEGKEIKPFFLAIPESKDLLVAEN